MGTPRDSVLSSGPNLPRSRMGVAHAAIRRAIQELAPGNEVSASSLAIPPWRAGGIEGEKMSRRQAIAHRIVDSLCTVILVLTLAPMTRADDTPGKADLAALVKWLGIKDILPALEKTRIHGSSLGRTCYVVERTLSWFGSFRRLTLCYEQC
jgi:hypothetical protein